jgi:hypothetical protein
MSIQLLGYVASILIAASLLMRSIVRLRIINMAGAATFSLYGFLIGAYPVGILNLMTTGINLVQLVRLRRRREIFRILEVSPNTQYLEYFLDFQRDDIRRFIPAFTYRPERTDVALFVLRDLIPAGLLLGRLRGDQLEVQLDYAVPQYRDMKIGRFLFIDEADYFRRRGIREIVTPADTEAHAEYLSRIGFEPDGRMYRLRLDLGATASAPRA